MKNLAKKYLKVRDLVMAGFTMMLLLLLMAVGSNAVFAFIRNVETAQLQAFPSSNFMMFYEVESTKDEYSIGEAPEFFFTREYYVSGHVDGNNVLRCPGHYSSYHAEGEIEELELNTLKTGEPFRFGGDLPDTPKTCFLRSIIKLCEPRHNVCKTQVIRSNTFEFK